MNVRKSRIIAASVAFITMGAIAVPSAQAAEIRVEDSVLKAPQPLTLQVPSGQSIFLQTKLYESLAYSVIVCYTNNHER